MSKNTTTKLNGRLKFCEKTQRFQTVEITDTHFTKYVVFTKAGIHDADFNDEEDLKTHLYNNYYDVYDGYNCNDISRVEKVDMFINNGRVDIEIEEIDYSQLLNERIDECADRSRDERAETNYLMTL